MKTVYNPAEPWPFPQTEGSTKMETQSESTKGGKGRGKGTGRRGANGQEAILEITKLNDSMPRLLKLKAALKDATEDYSAAVKKCGEASGFNAKVIRTLVDAKAGDKFDDVKRIVDQMGEAFSLEG